MHFELKLETISSKKTSCQTQKVLCVWQLVFWLLVVLSNYFTKFHNISMIIQFFFFKFHDSSTHVTYIGDFPGFLWFCELVGALPFICIKEKTLSFEGSIWKNRGLWKSFHMELQFGEWQKSDTGITVPSIICQLLPLSLVMCWLEHCSTETKCQVKDFLITFVFIAFLNSQLSDATW